MRKIGSLRLMIGASIIALSAGTSIFLAFADDKSGQVAKEVADAGGAAIPDRPDWNWDIRPILSQNCFSCHGQSVQKAGLRLDLQRAAYDPIPEHKSKRAIVPAIRARASFISGSSPTTPTSRCRPRRRTRHSRPRTWP